MTSDNSNQLSREFVFQISSELSAQVSTPPFHTTLAVSCEAQILIFTQFYTNLIAVHHTGILHLAEQNTNACVEYKCVVLATVQVSRALTHSFLVFS